MNPIRRKLVRLEPKQAPVHSPVCLRWFTIIRYESNLARIYWASLIKILHKRGIQYKLVLRAIELISLGVKEIIWKGRRRILHGWSWTKLATAITRGT